MRANEFLIEQDDELTSIPGGSAANVNALKNNSQVRKIAQGMLQNFNGMVANQIRARQSQGDTGTELNNNEYENLLRSFIEKVLLPKEVLQNANSLIKGNVASAIKQIVSGRDNPNAIDTNFLNLVVNAIAAKKTGTPKFKANKVNLKLKPNSVLNTEKYGEIKWDGTKWNDSNGPLLRQDQEALNQMLGQ